MRRSLELTPSSWGQIELTQPPPVGTGGEGHAGIDPAPNPEFRRTLVALRADCLDALCGAGLDIRQLVGLSIGDVRLTGAGTLVRLSTTPASRDPGDRIPGGRGRTGPGGLLEKLAEARSQELLPSLVGLEKTLAFNLSGHVLHTILWENLSPAGGDRPGGELAAAIGEHFGSFEAFAGELTAVASTVQGTGWGVLAVEPMAQRLIVEQVYDHHGNVGTGSTPLLVFDAWEHAYYLQYRNVRPDYVQQLWSLVNWTDVDRRFQRAHSAPNPVLLP